MWHQTSTKTLFRYKYLFNRQVVQRVLKPDTNTNIIHRFETELLN